MLSRPTGLWREFTEETGDSAYAAGAMTGFVRCLGRSSQLWLFRSALGLWQ